MIDLAIVIMVYMCTIMFVLGFWLIFIKREVRWGVTCFGVSMMATVVAFARVVPVWLGATFMVLGASLVIMVGISAVTSGSRNRDSC